MAHGAGLTCQLTSFIQTTKPNGTIWWHFISGGILQCIAQALATSSSSGWVKSARLSQKDLRYFGPLLQKRLQTPEVGDS